MAGTKRRKPSRRNKKHSAAADVLRLIYALLLIVTAVLVVYFVIIKVKDISGSKNNMTAAEASTEESSAPSQSEPYEDNNDTPGFKESEEGKSYLKENGEYAAKEWISIDGSLYYFDEAGFVKTGVMEENGEIFKFDKEGRVTDIKYDPDYKAPEEEAIKEYSSLVKSKNLWVYLSGDKTLGEFDMIMYKRTTDARSYTLGGEENPQFSSPYSMQIDGNTVYYLPLSESDKLTEEEKKINGTLYRMKLGGEYREIIAQNVSGYKVVSGEVYYMSNGRLYSTKNGVKDETKTVYSSNSISLDEFAFEERDGDLYLLDSAGNPVKTSDNIKRVGSFTYTLSDEGEILGVRDKTAVTTGGWTYYTETDGSTGKNVSKILRKNSEGTVQEVSADFAGTTGNMFYDYSNGTLVAEYMPNSDSYKLIVINKNGDVDAVDCSEGVSDMELYALINGEAVCKVLYSNGTVYETYKLSNAVPIAIGVISDNIIRETSSSGENAEGIKESGGVTEIPQQTLAPVETTEAPSPSAPADPESGNTGAQGGAIVIG